MRTILSIIVMPIMLSPLGSVSVHPGRQVLLTCEMKSVSDSLLQWTVSIPHLATTHEKIVQNQGDLLVPEFKIGFTKFSITRTSERPLISQLLITNVTTEINGSTIYCHSKDDNENGIPMTTIYVIYKGARFYMVIKLEYSLIIISSIK